MPPAMTSYIYQLVKWERYSGKSVAYAVCAIVRLLENNSESKFLIEAVFCLA